MTRGVLRGGEWPLPSPSPSGSTSRALRLDPPLQCRFVWTTKPSEVPWVLTQPQRPQSSGAMAVDGIRGGGIGAINPLLNPHSAPGNRRIVPRDAPCLSAREYDLKGLSLIRTSLIFRYDLRQQVRTRAPSYILIALTMYAQHIACIRGWPQRWRTYRGTCAYPGR